MPSDPPSETGHPSTPQRRALGSFERAQLLTSEAGGAFNLVVALRLKGVVDGVRLCRALTDLQRRHPLLAARLVGKPASAAFELGGVPPIPLRTLRREREPSWIDVVEEELSTGFDRATGPLARCCLLDSGSAAADSEIILTLPHVIVDASSAVRIVENLLEFCGSEAAAPPGATEEAQAVLPPRADDLFPSRYRGLSGFWPSCRFLAREMAGEIAYRWRTRSHRSRPPLTPDGESARCRILPIAFSEADTQALVRATRMHGLTLNNALNAALLLAIARHRYPGTDLPHRYFVFPTLRPYLDPPVPEECDGGYLTTMRLTVRISETRDVWDLAQEMQDQVLRAAKQGGRYLAARFSAMSMKMILRQSSYRMGTLGMSYTGAYPFKLEHGALRLVAIHAFVSNFPIGAECTGQARIFRGRFCMDILYMEVDMNEDEARSIAEETRSILVSGSQSEAEPRDRVDAH